MLYTVGFLHFSTDVIMPKWKTNHKPKLDKTTVKLQYNATKQLTQNGNYPHTNHTEEHFIPECKLFFFFFPYKPLFKQ